MEILHFVTCTPVDGYPDCAHLLSVANNATMDVSVQVSVRGPVRSLERTSSGVAGVYGGPIFNFLRTCQTFPRGRAVLCSPQQRTGIQFFCILAWYLAFFLDNSLPNGHEMVPHCGFDGHFPNESCRASFPVLIGHLYIILGEMSIQVLYPFWLFLGGVVVVEL